MTQSEQFVTQSEEYVRMLVRMHGEDSFQRKVWAAFVDAAQGFSTVDWAASLELAARYRTRQSQCFNNCMKIAVRHPELQYFEGTAAPIIPVEHAWLVDQRGIVLDPTLCLQEDHGQRRADYFGMHVPLRQLRMPRENPFEPAWMRMLLEQMKENAQK